MQRERTKLYNELIDILMDTIKLGSKAKHQPKTITALGIRQQTVGLKMLAIASDEVMEKFLKWRALSILQEENHMGVFKAFADILIAIRKETIPITTRTSQDFFDILT